jgi:hypothetical protein
MKKPDTPQVEEQETPEDRFEREIEELEAPSWRRDKTQIFVWILLVVIVAIGVAWMVTRERQQLQAKASAPTTLRIEMLEPRPGRLTNTPTKFRWEVVSGTKYYAFRLTEQGRDAPVIERAATLNKVELTPEEAGRLLKGKTYLFEVLAYSDLGKIQGQAQGKYDL